MPNYISGKELPNPVIQLLTDRYGVKIGEVLREGFVVTFRAQMEIPPLIPGAEIIGQRDKRVAIEIGVCRITDPDLTMQRLLREDNVCVYLPEGRRLPGINL